MLQTVRIDDQDWLDIKQFKDPVYGYIPINRAYVKCLIDTQMMQRIKGVAQTGLRPVFSSATHDRFSHSLGVYKFGMQMFDSLKDKLESYTKSHCFPKWNLTPEQEKNIPEKLHDYMAHWKTLLAIACLLHDIGHPVQSHGFEFLYDDPYLDVEYKMNDPVIIHTDMPLEEKKRVYNFFLQLAHNLEKKPDGNLRKALLDAFHDKGDIQNGLISGSPHERMSAYYILKDEQLGYNIAELIKASREKNSLLPCCDTDINLDFCFIARMIIGWEYQAPEQLSFQEDVFFNSIKNCVIHILNGSIDADGLDYLMRNSYAAGYDTSKVDSTRLCNAYTAYTKHYIMFPAFSKSALSVLEGYMSARNFEPKWLYSHHKVVYADLLTKRLYKYVTRYLAEKTMLCQSVMYFIKYANQSAIVNNGKQNLEPDILLQPGKTEGTIENKVSLGINQLHAHIENWSYPFYTYLLAPCRNYIIFSHHFNKTADADLDALFHWMYNELAQHKGSNVKERYNYYNETMIKNVLDDLHDNLINSDIKKQLRILLAESCLNTIDVAVDSARELLQNWIETGNKEDAFASIKAQGNDSVFAPVINMLNGIKSDDNRDLLEYFLRQYRPLLTEADYTDFLSLLDEYHTRCYRKSLWKSWPEYQLFLKDCANQLGIPSSDVHRYMLALIDDGMREHGFSIFDGKAEKNVPDLYREQFFYQYHEQAKKSLLFAKLVSLHVPVTPLEAGKQIAQSYATTIFSENDDYDFSQTKLTVKLYKIKPKHFSEIHLLFNNRPVLLGEVLPHYKNTEVTFPYFYYTDDINRKPEAILEAFQKRFIDFCRAYRESEVRSENIKMEQTHTLRDSLYGDIEIPENFYAIISTREFQRLGRIRQLATADRKFPNATHTRLAHSIGTWHVMRQILQHFKQLYKDNPRLDFSEHEMNCALLAALLHDLGHGPYSHASEKVFDFDHEEMTRKIIRDGNTEIHNIIKDKFGVDSIERVCGLLSGAKPTTETSGIDLIYESLISGQLDADRIDYLMRDNASCGMSFGHIDIQQLISSMRMIPDYNNTEHNAEYCLCFDDRYLSAIEQFIYARYQMYMNVYHDPQKQLFEQLLQSIFTQAVELLDEIEPNKYFMTLKNIKNGSGSISDYIALDDEALNVLIKDWADGNVLKKGASKSADIECRAEIVTLLSQAFLNQHHLFERVDLGEKAQQYDQLAKRIGELLDLSINSFIELSKECCAFICITGNSFAYEKKDNEKKNIVLRNLDDGTTKDYLDRSMFRSAITSNNNYILRSDYCYLFFSEELLRKYCMLHKKPDKTDIVRKTIESAKPRRHIEIEKKFYCTEEQLNKAKEYIENNYKDAIVSDKNQEDTYFDFISDDKCILYENHYSFRCRKIDGQYVFTIKIPTESPNYHSPSQFARHEHELETSTESITDDVWNFLIYTLEIYGAKDILKNQTKDQIKAQLVVHNHRTLYRLEKKCEICLDEVYYTTADGMNIGSQNYQIEIELLSEPENWSNLENEIITPLVQYLGEDSLSYTSKSKFDTGMDLLMNQNHAN